MSTPDTVTSTLRGLAASGSAAILAARHEPIAPFGERSFATQAATPEAR